jgi:hypothetical protein
MLLALYMTFTLNLDLDLMNSVFRKAYAFNNKLSQLF